MVRLPGLSIWMSDIRKLSEVGDPPTRLRELV